MAAVALRKIGYDASNVSVGWCWVNLDAEDRLLWMLLTGKLWEILAYVTLPVLYILIRKHINRAVSALLPDPSPCSAFWAPCTGRSCWRTLRVPRAVP